MELPAGEPRSLTADFDRSVGDFFWAADGKSLYFEVEDRGDVNLCVVPANGGAVKTVIGGETAGRGYHVDVAAGPKDEFFVYRHRPMAHSFEIFRCDKAGKDVKQITFANKDVYEGFFVPQGSEEYWWKAADGADVHGWLIKPMDFDPAKKYPMMVRVHGGPQQMWVNGFRTEYALFTGAGYAVFFCNPRGSGGYGQKFCDDIRGDWDGKPVDDLKAGVRTVLEKNPWIDAEARRRVGGQLRRLLLQLAAGAQRGQDVRRARLARGGRRRVGRLRLDRRALVPRMGSHRRPVGQARGVRPDLGDPVREELLARRTSSRTATSTTACRSREGKRCSPHASGSACLRR